MSEPLFKVGDEVETSGTERGYARGFVIEFYPQSGSWVYSVKNEFRGNTELVIMKSSVGEEGKMKFKEGDLVTTNPNEKPFGVNITHGKNYVVTRTDKYREDGKYHVYITCDDGAEDAWWSMCFIHAEPQPIMHPEFDLDEIHQAQQVYEKINGN